MLTQVVGARELLATVCALKRLLMSVERSVVALEMFLASEATAAKGADEGLRWVVGEGLLAAAARDTTTLSGCR